MPALLLTLLIGCGGGGESGKSPTGGEPPEAGGEAAAEAADALPGSSQSPAAPAGPTPAQPAAPPPGEGRRRTNVEALRLRPRSFTVERTYIGHLLPGDRISLRSGVEGVVEQASFEEGDRVELGGEIVQVATSQFSIRRDLARSNLNLAEATFNREKQLRAKNLLSPAQLDITRNRLEVARFTLQLAELDLKKSVVLSPIAGFVKKKGKERGEFARKGDLLAEILAISTLKVLINVPEKEIGHISSGQQVRITLDAVKGLESGGTVKTIGLEAEAGNRSFPVEIMLENPQRNFRPGMLARVTVEVGRYSGQVLIPRYAVLERERGRVVFVAHQGRALEREIEIGVSQDGDVQVNSGLKFGEALIVKGQHKLRPGEPVNLLKVREQPAGAAEGP